MCLVLEWKTGLWAKAIDPLLLPFNEMTTCESVAVVDSLSPPHAISRSYWMLCTHVFCSETLMKTCCWSGCKSPSSVSSRRSHVASFVASVKAMYSASVDDNATVGCLFEHQLTGLPLSIKIKPEVDFWLSLSPAQSKLEYPSMRSLSWLP